MGVPGARGRRPTQSSWRWCEEAALWGTWGSGVPEQYAAGVGVRGTCRRSPAPMLWQTGVGAKHCATGERPKNPLYCAGKGERSSTRLWAAVNTHCAMMGRGYAAQSTCERQAGPAFFFCDGVPRWRTPRRFRQHLLCDAQFQKGEEGSGTCVAAAATTNIVPPGSDVVPQGALGRRPERFLSRWGGAGAYTATTGGSQYELCGAGVGGGCMARSSGTADHASDALGLAPPKPVGGRRCVLCGSEGGARERGARGRPSAPTYCAVGGARSSGRSSLTANTHG